MEQDDFVRVLAGAVVLAGLGGGYLVHEYLYLLAAFAAFNLLQSPFTNFCLAEKFYQKTIG